MISVGANVQEITKTEHTEQLTVGKSVLYSKHKFSGITRNVGFHKEKLLSQGHIALELLFL